MAQPAQSIDGVKRRLSPQTSAWLMLLAFFLIFCILVAVAGIAGWRYYTFATVPVPNVLLRVHVNAGVLFQPRGEAGAESVERLPAESDPCYGHPDICKLIGEGDQVIAKREAGYGPVASIVLPDRSQIDLWAHPTGAEVALDRYRVTRWTDRRQEVLLRQASGYARYDVRSDQRYDEVAYTVEISDGVRVELEPGGSYSVNIPGLEQEKPRARTITGTLLLAEVAVRAGRATLWSGERHIGITAGQKAQIDLDKRIGEPHPARWQLIRDGDFRQHATRNYLDGQPTWQAEWILSSPGLMPEQRNGTFAAVKACRPETPDFCTPADQVYIGRFRREGNQQRSFGIGIFQNLDLDVSEYRSLRFTAWVRVLYQTVPRAGIAGSECPITIQFVYKQRSPTDEEQRRYFCVYADEQNSGVERGESEFEYRSVPLYQWYRLTYELRGDPSLKSAYYLQTIRIYANGHDYISEIANVSLIGGQ